MQDWKMEDWGGGGRCMYNTIHDTTYGTVEVTLSRHLRWRVEMREMAVHGCTSVQRLAAVPFAPRRRLKM